MGCARERAVVPEAVVRGRVGLDAQPEYLYNQSEAYLKNSDIEKAIQCMEDFLSTDPPAKDREEVEVAMAWIHKKLERTRVPLSVSSDPEGADFRAECGDFTADGRTPWDGWVPPGECDLVVTADGHQTERERFLLTLGNPKEIAVALEEERSEAPDHGAAVTGDVEPGASRPPPKPLPAAQAPAADEGSGVPLGAYAGWGVGAAALVGGVVLGTLATSRASEYESELDSLAVSMRSREDLQSLRDSAQTMGVAATAAFGVAAAAAGAGTALWLLAPGPDGATVRLRCTW